MKCLLRIFLILLVVTAVTAPTASAALTYGSTYYLNNLSYFGSGNPSLDPAYLLFAELDGIFSSTGGAFGSLTLTPATEPTSAAEGMLYYDIAGNVVKMYNGAAWVTLEAGSSTYSLDAVYDVGSAITVDDGAVTLTAPNANDSIVLAIVQADTGGTAAQTITSAGTGALLSFDSNGTGADLLGSDSTWTITKAGALTCVGVTTTGNVNFDSVDVHFDATDAGKDITWDDSEETLGFSDNAVLGFGNTAAAPDVEIVWDADSLNMTAAIADTAWEIGGIAGGFDITYAFETAGNLFIDYDGDFMTLTDDMDLRFGTGAGTKNGDFQVSSNSSNVLNIGQVVADTGSITIGADGTGMDMTWYSDTAADYMKWDEDNEALEFVGANVDLDDDSKLIVGSDSDFTIYTDTAGTLEFDPAAAGNTIKFGTADTDAVDMIWYADVSGDTVTFDEENVVVQFEDVKLQMMDDTLLSFGDADDVTIQYDENGNDRLQITGSVSIEGTTPTLTVGDAGEEDAKVVFDGAAQDFHVGLDDTADDLVIGVGSALGTTPAIEIDENRNVTVSASLKVPYEVVTAANVITSNEGGKTFLLNSATEFQSTLPAVSTSAGMHLTFIVKAAPSGASYTIITGNSLENVIYGCVQESETDDTEDGPTAQAQDTVTITDGVAVIGDRLDFFCDGTYWYVSGMTAADGAVAFSQAD